MKTNRLKSLLAGQTIAVGAQLRFGSPAIAELFGLAGFDWILIDGEHAPQSPVGIQAQLHAIGCTDATPIVRVRTNDPELFRVYLDMGAGGIVAPFVNTAEQASCGAASCRYPPVGTRGTGPSRAHGYGLEKGYFQNANDQVLYLPIIESAEAVDQIEQIIAVDGVDAFIIGPVDLSVSLGAPFDFENASYQDALKRCVAAANQVGKPAGIGVTGDVFEPETIKRDVAAGFRLLLATLDEAMVAESCRRIMSNANSARGHAPLPMRSE